MKMYRIRKDDKVMVIAGKDAGKIGKVLKILRKKDRVLVEKTNMVKRHMRPNPYAQQPGGIVEKEMPIHVSNLWLSALPAARPLEWVTRPSSPRARKRKCASAKSATKSWNKVIR